jgi:dienelactone hydrolase
MLLLQGTKDPLVTYQQAILLRDRLQADDVEVELVSLEGAGHGFGGQDLQRAEQAANEFLDKHLKPGGRGNSSASACAAPQAASAAPSAIVQPAAQPTVQPAVTK